MEVVETVTNSRAARGVNYVLGVWLFISAFVWHHGVAQRANACVVGALCVLFALTALRQPAARRLNTALSIWLFISVWALPRHSEATMWNNAVIAVVVFLLSLVPDRGEPRLAPRHAPA